MFGFSDLLWGIGLVAVLLGLSGIWPPLNDMIAWIFKLELTPAQRARKIRGPLQDYAIILKTTGTHWIENRFKDYLQSLGLRVNEGDFAALDGVYEVIIHSPPEEYGDTPRTCRLTLRIIWGMREEQDKAQTFSSEDPNDLFWQAALYLAETVPRLDKNKAA